VTFSDPIISIVAATGLPPSRVIMFRMLHLKRTVRTVMEMEMEMEVEVEM
jgi:hypothetical protein